MGVKTAGLLRADLAVDRQRQDHRRRRRGDRQLLDESRRASSAASTCTRANWSGRGIRARRTRTRCRRRRISLHQQFAQLVDAGVLRREARHRLSADGRADARYLGRQSHAAAERYSSALVALDIKTGKLAWSYQTVHHDLWDMDLPSQPTLVDMHRQGRRPGDHPAGQDRQSVRARPPHRRADRAGARAARAARRRARRPRFADPAVLRTHLPSEAI